MTIGEVLQAIQTVEAKITEQVKLGTKRDKSVIRTLQAEHAGLTKQLAGLHEPDGETPKDKSDNSGKEFRKAKAVRVPAIIPPTPDTFQAVEGELLAYCQKCKTKQPMVNPVIAPTKGGKNGAKGTCGTCNSKLFRLVKQ